MLNERMNPQKHFMADWISLSTSPTRKRSKNFQQLFVLGEWQIRQKLRKHWEVGMKSHVVWPRRFSQGQLTHSTWKGKLMSLIFPIQMIFSQHLHHDERSQDRPPFFRFVAFSRIFRCICSEKLGLQGCPGSRHLNSILQIYNFRE